MSIDRREMTAVRIHEYGGPEVIRVERVPVPVPGPGEVLVETAAMAHNPSDVWFRAGHLREILPADLPATLGADLSGTVVALGAGVVGFGIGNAVIGRIDTGHTAAEYVAAAAGDLVAAPTSIPLADAAAIPVAGLTAWEALMCHAGPLEGRRVLVNGGGGGVGSFAVQIARHAGAEVLATVSPRSAAAVASYGAEHVLDRTDPSWRDGLAGTVDVLVNAAGIPPEVAASLGSLVRPGGRVVSAATPIPVPDGVTSAHFVAANDPRRLAELVALVDSGAVVVDVSRRARLADAAEIHRDFEAGRLRAKVILVP